LDQLEQRLIALMTTRLARAQGRLRPARERLALASPRRRLDRLGLILTTLSQRLGRAQARLIETRQARLIHAAAGLEARSPLATLARGYAIVTRLPEGLVLRSPEQATPGTRIQARLAEGAVIAVVTEAASESS
jgi:exodeoxyribonuclease VII large subunit